jgi:hypothetical protein
MTDRRADIEATLAQAGQGRHRGRWAILLAITLIAAAGA